MEGRIMKILMIIYDDDTGINRGANEKGCIARMIATRKSELNKLINKRSDSTHQKKISSKRLKTDTNESSQRKMKRSFSVTGSNIEEYFNRDGSVYSNSSKYAIILFNNHFYMEKI